MSLDIAGLLYVGGISFLLYCVWLLVFLHQKWPLAELALAAFLGACCQIIATQLLVGWLGLLTLPYLLGINILVSAGLLLYARKNVQKPDLIERWATVCDVVRQIRKSPTVIVMLVFLTAWLLWTIFLGLIFPPYSSDEHYYHMPIVTSIVSQARIGLIETHIPWVQAYPKNSELMSVWVSVLQHRDTLADLVMVPFWLAGGLAIYAAARRFKVSVPVAILATSVFCFAPNALIQIKSTYNDVMIAALWAIGFSFAVPPRDNRVHPSSLATSILLGIAAGLIVGSKYTGGLHFLALAALLALYPYQRVSFRAVFQRLLIYGIVATLVGGYWYLSNWIHFSNPLWPFGIQLAGVSIFPGRLDAGNLVGTDGSLPIVGHLPLWQRWFFAWFDRQEIVMVDSRLSGFGPFWIVLGLPSLVIWLVLAAKRRDWYIWAMTGIFLAMLIATPVGWVPRYSLFLLALGGVALAVVYNELGEFPKNWINTLVMVLPLFAMFVSVNHQLFSVNRIRNFAAYADIDRTPLNFDSNTFGASYRWVAHQMPEGATLAYAANVTRPFPLWGAYFQRDVISVVPESPASYVDELIEADVDYVFVATKGEQYAALEADPRVELAFDGNDGWKVFKLNP